MESIPNIYVMVPSSTGYKYLNLIFLDTFLDLLLILSSNQKFVSIFHDIMHSVFLISSSIFFLFLHFTAKWVVLVGISQFLNILKQIGYGLWGISKFLQLE
jgi:hypothetical protein